MPENWVQHPVINTEAGSNPGAPLAWGSPENPDDAVAGYGYVPCDTSEVEETFYYHSDHLGSTAYITDQKANVTQYDAYLPYGELLVDEHSSSADLPYKFNGKELDEETGLYYYGARYMNPVTSMWYGVDPLTEKYTNVSAFVYCMGNPIILYDHAGKSPVSFFAKLCAKQGLKNGAKMAVRAYVEKQCPKVLTKKWGTKLLNGAEKALDIAMSESLWEVGVEMIPVVGDAYGGLKLTKTGLKVWKLVERIQKRISAVESTLKGTGKLRKALGLTSGEAHHIIPVKLLKENEVVQDAVAAGFDFNGVVNGVQAAKHHGPHKKYTDMVESALNVFKDKHPDYSPEQAKAFVEKLASGLKEEIQNNKNKLIKN